VVSGHFVDLVPIVNSLLDRLLRAFVTAGTLRVTWPDGTCTPYGPGGAPAAGVHLTRAGAVRRIITDPALALGELYMDGGLVPVGCGINEVVDTIGANLATSADALPGITIAAVLGRLRRRIDQFNPVFRSRRNVAHHYDLDGRLYALFLDPDRQYSCAYFPSGGETLEQAQAAKKRHIAAKLQLDRPGLRVLDIGCGWGGLALTLARDFGCEVDGITLSQEQHAAATLRAEQAGLAERVRFRLLDYRALEERYDRVVSVGMFEHVGFAQYGAFFERVRACLADDGVAMLHTIGRSDGPRSTNRWMAKYIFPGGYCPALSEMLPVIERSGLIATDIEILRLHYAMTLREWRVRFAAQRAVIAGLYDERFCRMFEFYLSLSEMSFRRLTHVNFQIQLTRRIDATPLTRDAMLAAG
jgi:cyclopropane-fatty-acyl-phospholipid synthase